MTSNFTISHQDFNSFDGWLGVDIYSTAWAAMVPDAKALDRPAWPEALDYLRDAQLADGGWGSSQVYYAHERTIATLAAILALRSWKTSPQDEEQIRKGLAALRGYAQKMTDEPHEPIGFEMLLPRLKQELIPNYRNELPLTLWEPAEIASREKFAQIQHLKPNPSEPATWWVSMEMLSEEQLAKLDDTYLDPFGAILTSTAATAAYLRARRRAGYDSPRASTNLKSLLKRGLSGLPFCWPAEIFDRLWSLDAFRRAGFDPRNTFLRTLAEQVWDSWKMNGEGISYSDVFPISDSDHTLVGFATLQWAGYNPSDKAMLSFWDTDHFLTYHNERKASVSANIHGLTALRSQPGFPHQDMAIRLTDWLERQVRSDVIFADKWHISPFYPVARAIPALAGWHDTLASRCVAFLLNHQRPDGGWGWTGQSTVEETAHCVLALSHPHELGGASHSYGLAKAAAFLGSPSRSHENEPLWIGKTLYQPATIVRALMLSAQAALEKMGHSIDYRPINARAAMPKGRGYQQSNAQRITRNGR